MQGKEVHSSLPLYCNLPTAWCCPHFQSHSIPNKTDGETGDYLHSTSELPKHLLS